VLVRRGALLAEIAGLHLRLPVIDECPVCTGSVFKSHGLDCELASFARVYCALHALESVFLQQFGVGLVGLHCIREDAAFGLRPAAELRWQQRLLGREHRLAAQREHQD
jgi:hypothetical protein